jgi:hypothetical protein
MTERDEARRRWPLGRPMLLDTGGLNEETGQWMHWANPLVTGKPGRPRRRPKGAQTWQEMLNAILADGVTITASTAESYLCPDFSIPAYYMAPGRVLRITAGGKASNTTTASVTLIYRLRWGTTGTASSGTVLAASGAIPITVTARTDFSWYLSLMVVCRTEGATASFTTMGSILQNNIDPTVAVNPWNTVAMPQSGNATVSSGIDTTSAKLLTLTAQWAGTVTSTATTCEQRIIEALN